MRPEFSRPDLPKDVAVRLEAVRLAHRFDREPWQVIAAAEVYAEWVLRGSVEGVEAGVRTRPED